MKTILAFITVCLICSVLSCKEKKQPAPEPAPAPMVEDTIKPAPVVEKIETVKPVKNEVQHYFLIAGCFEYKELADKLCDKLQKEGFDSKLIPYFENLYLVSYNGYATRKEALEALKELRQEKGKEKTWMYKLDN